MSPHRDDAESVTFPDSPTIDAVSSGHNGINGSSNGTNGATNGAVSGGAVNGINGTHSADGHVVGSLASPFLESADLNADLDLICVGFGPASLAIAIAMHDNLAAGKSLIANGAPPKVLFLEKQHRFAWHAGMLLPGAKMQISFIKDLATLRDPRSDFTFLNYLHKADRLVEFTNLGTFLPARVEYEDYLRWCASHFDHVVQYNNEVVSVSPEGADAKDSVRRFAVRSRNSVTGSTQTYHARHVLIAVGGQPSLPRHLPAKHPRVIHSSQYAHMVPKILTDPTAPYRVTVIGAGQSAAEIFNNIQVLYPNSHTRMVMRSEFLRPSDDSPFINSIFNPEYVNSIFNRSSQYRRGLLNEARSTNYSVVRLELIEQLYEKMYDQRREYGVEETRWPHRIMGGWEVIDVQAAGEENKPLKLTAQRIDQFGESNGAKNNTLNADEVFEADLVIAATGYQRTAHLDLLRDTWTLLPESSRTDGVANLNGWTVGDNTKCGDCDMKKLEVGRDYQIKFAPGRVAEGSGVWLQGCCEGTHGLSDTLLSVLATRSGELVQSMFGDRRN